MYAIRSYYDAIPAWEKQRVVETALEYPEKSPRELAWYITDTCGYYISESSVYRILKTHDLVTSPVYTVISAQDKFPHPTRITSYNVCYTKLLRRLHRDPGIQHGRVSSSGFSMGDKGKAERA